MFRLLIYLLILPVFAFGQSDVIEKSELYSQAIEEYLRAIYKNGEPLIDTLFIGQYEHLKDLKLQRTILNTKIILLPSDEEGAKRLEYRKSYHYTNIAEIKFSKERAEFGFIRFLVEKSNGKVSSWPIHNGYIDFNFNASKMQFTLDKVYFKYPYSNSYTKKQ